MRVVWSFWSKPYAAGTGFRWGTELHHLLAWVLSVRLARAHYAETMLVTDDAGKALLVDRLGLPFGAVSTELERLRDADPRLWALGKLVAYGLQERPFVHVDTDVFLWKALPARLTAAAVFAQQPENYHAADEACGPGAIETIFDRHHCELPVEWRYARSRWGRRFHEINCGIVGGTRADFFRYFAELATGLALDSRNAASWAAIGDAALLNTVIEQFFLAACVEYHRGNPRSPYRGIEPRYLFSSWEDALGGGGAARAGFTHLLAGAKRNQQILARLEQRVRQVEPELYERCRAILKCTRSGYVPNYDG